MKRTYTALAVVLSLLALLVGCAPQPEQAEVWEMEEESVVVFSDGQTVDRWRAREGELRGSVAWYELSDGTPLLLEDDPAEPANTAGMGEAAWTFLIQTLSDWGLRYDPASLLEEAYARYQACLDEGEEFAPGEVGQATALTAQAEQVVYLCTTVTVAPDPEASWEIRLGSAFDRETGQPLDFFSLFAADEATVRAALTAFGEEEFRAGQAAALDPEWVVFYPDYLEVCVPAQTLPQLEQGLVLRWDYAQLDGLLQPWAAPNGTEEP